MANKAKILGGVATESAGHSPEAAKHYEDAKKAATRAKEIGSSKSKKR